MHYQRHSAIPFSNYQTNSGIVEMQAFLDYS